MLWERKIAVGYTLAMPGPFLQFPQYAALAVQPVVVADQNGRIFLIQGDQAVIPQTLDKSLAVEEENANLPSLTLPSRRSTKTMSPSR